MKIQDKITKLSPKDGDILVVRSDWSSADSLTLTHDIARVAEGLQIKVGIICLYLDESLELLSAEDLDRMGLQRKV